MIETDRRQATAWKPLDPRRATELVDARLQVHHAAQLATALGISYLPHEPDDSHTNFEWREELSALASKAARGTSAMRLAVRPRPFELLVLDESYATTASLPLHGKTIEGTLPWIQAQLAEHGFDPKRYTLRRHYAIPYHPVAESGAFDASREDAFEQLAHYYSDAAAELEKVVSATPNSAAVHCWPHHFDIATLIEVAPAAGGKSAKSISLGMTPGDKYYDDPYFYASVYPPPGTSVARDALDGGGQWHTHEWLGAVLPGSRLETNNQREQVASFIASAVRGCTKLLMSA